MKRLEKWINQVAGGGPSAEQRLGNTGLGVVRHQIPIRGGNTPARPFVFPKLDIGVNYDPEPAKKRG